MLRFFFIVIRILASATAGTIYASDYPNVGYSCVCVCVFKRSNGLSSACPRLP